jgi:glycosyltransferase involved in cell wall biosynthesis
MSAAERPPLHDLAGPGGGLRVLLVTKGLDLGGIERVVTDLAIELRVAGVDVEVALVNSARDRLAATVERAGVPIHRLDGTDLIGFGAACRLARLVRSGRHDIVHVHGPLPSVVARIAALPTTRRPRVVTTSHTPWPSLRLLTRLAWSATARADSAVVAVSAEVAASLPAASRRRAIVIPHGIDPDRIARALCAAAVGTRDSSVPTNVISVASHRDAKNYPNLLHGVKIATEQGADLRLHTIGDGPNLETHRQLAVSLGLGDIVTFAPTTDDVLTEIARADVLAVASDYEGQPIVVAEALALGVPVVATAVGRVPEMVNATTGRIVSPGDPDALGAALVELATSPELRAEMSANARRHHGSWTLDDVVAAHLAVYLAVEHPSAR